MFFFYSYAQFSYIAITERGNTFCIDAHWRVWYNYTSRGSAELPANCLNNNYRRSTKVNSFSAPMIFFLFYMHSVC